MERSPIEKEFDLICDALADIHRLPHWERMDDNNVSTLTLSESDILYATHVLKHENRFEELYNMGYGFFGNKDGSYTITSWPEYLTGVYTWDYNEGALFYGGKKISD